MGLFDRFKKRVKEVAEEVDSDALTATEDSVEGKAALETAVHYEEEWEDADTEETEQSPTSFEEEQSGDDDWDDWDDEEDDIELPVQLSKKNVNVLRNLRNNDKRNSSEGKQRLLRNQKVPKSTSQ